MRLSVGPARRDRTFSRFLGSAPNFRRFSRGKAQPSSFPHSCALTVLFAGSSATRTVSTNPLRRPALTTILFDADVHLAHDATTACRRVACLDDGISQSCHRSRMPGGLKLRHRNLLARKERHDIKDTMVQTPFYKTRHVMRTDDQRSQCGAADR